MLDNLTSGLQPSELIILAARPSMGKTAFALNLAENVGVRGNKPVAIFSLEMSKESLLLRLLSADAKIDSHKFRTGHLNHEDKAQNSQVAEPSVRRRRSGSTTRGSATVVEMGAKLRRMKREKGLSLVIVDYLQLVSARGKFGNRNEEVSSITRGLKAMAKELKVPMLVLSQLTRAPEREDREPRLADLRESGAIEQDADVVMFIHRPNFFKKSSEVSIGRTRRNRSDHRQTTKRPDRFASVSCFRAASRALNRGRRTPGRSRSSCPQTPTGVSVRHRCDAVFDRHVSKRRLCTVYLSSVKIAALYDFPSGIRGLGIPFAPLHAENSAAVYSSTGFSLWIFGRAISDRNPTG